MEIYKEFCFVAVSMVLSVLVGVFIVGSILRGWELAEQMWKRFKRKIQRR